MVAIRRHPHGRPGHAGAEAAPAGTDATARTRILDAAESLFGQHGFDATSTSAIAKQANVPKGLVFYYFPAKDDLLVALVDERLQVDKVTDPAALAVPGDPARSLLAFEAGLGLDTHHSAVLRIIVWREADTHPRVREHLHALTAALRTQTQMLLHACLGETVDQHRVDAAAAAWVAYVVSRANTKRWWKIDSSAVPDDAESVAVAELLAAGLATT